MQQVLANPALLAGFDDPDVMRAVNDIAKNPANLQKYQANPKVSCLLLCSVQVYKSDNVMICTPYVFQALQ